MCACPVPAGVPAAMVRQCLEDAFPDGDSSEGSFGNIDDVLRASGLKDVDDEDEPCLPDFEEAMRLAEARWVGLRLGRMSSLRGAAAPETGTGASRKKSGRSRGRGCGRLSRSPQRSPRPAHCKEGEDAPRARRVLVCAPTPQAPPPVPAPATKAPASPPVPAAKPARALRERPANACKDAGGEKGRKARVVAVAEEEEPLHRRVSSFRPSTLWSMIASGWTPNGGGVRLIR